MLSVFTGNKKLSAQYLQKKVTAMLIKRTSLLKSRCDERGSLLDEFLNTLFSYEALASDTDNNFPSNKNDLKLIKNWRRK